MSHRSYLLFAALLCTACAEDTVLLPSKYGDRSDVEVSYSPSSRSTQPNTRVTLRIGTVNAHKTNGLTLLSAKGLYRSVDTHTRSPLERSVLLVFEQTQIPSIQSIDTEPGPSANTPKLGLEQTDCRCVQRKGSAPTELIHIKPMEQTAVLRHLFDTGTQSVYRLTINPISFSQDLRSISVASEISVLIEATTRSNDRQSATNVLLEPALRTIAANRDVLHSNRSQSTASRTNTRPLLLIIAADELAPAFTEWMRWKSRQGLTPILVPLSRLGRDAADVRAFVVQRFYSHSQRPTFLLLAGDQNTLAPIFDEVSSDRNDLAATAYPLSFLDNRYVPEISVGRLLASQPEQAKAQLAKWIGYEKSTDDPQGAISSAAIIASKDGSNPSDEAYAKTLQELLHSYGFNTLDLLLESNNTATNRNIEDALLRGRSWVTYLGHGNGLQWLSANQHFGISNLASMPSYSSHPVVLDVSCRGAAFTSRNSTIGRAWVERADGGAVAYFGASVDTFWHEPAVMASAITRSHFEGRTKTLGQAITSGYLGLLERYGPTRAALDTIKSFLLFGDPSLHTRSSSVVRYTVSTETNCSLAKCTISAKAATVEDALPLQGIRISLTHDTAMQPIAVKDTDHLGIAVLEIGQTTDAPAWILSSSAPGHDTYITQVSPSQTRANDAR